MKRLIMSFLTLCMVSSGWAQNPVTTAEFDSYMYDFGKIREADGPVSYTFIYRNTGKTPLVITDIGTSCGCTIPQYNRAPLAPGASEKIIVTFDPVNQPGRVEKMISIRANVENGTIPLKIRASVEARPRTVFDDFPVALTDGIRLTDVSMNLGNQSRTKTTTHTLGVVNTSDKPVEIGVNSDNQMPSWAKATILKTTLNPGERTTLNLTLTPAQTNLWGRKVFPIPLLVNGSPQYIDVLVFMLFVEDFAPDAAGANAPRAQLNNYFYHFSTVHKGKPLTTKFLLKNTGVNPLKVRYLDHTSEIKAITSNTTIQTGEIATITLTSDGQTIGPLSEIVRIITNDPLKPVLEVRIMANIVE